MSLEKFKLVLLALLLCLLGLIIRKNYSTRRSSNALNHGVISVSDASQQPNTQTAKNLFIKDSMECISPPDNKTSSSSRYDKQITTLLLYEIPKGFKLKFLTTPAPPTLSFNPEDNKVSGVITKKGKEYVFQSGKETLEEYDWVSIMRYDPVKNGIAYHAEKGDQSFVVVNDKKIEALEFKFTKSGKFLYSGGQNCKRVKVKGTYRGQIKCDKYFISIDGKKEMHDWLNLYSLIESGGNYAYLASTGCSYPNVSESCREYAVINGNRTNSYEWINVISFQFIPHSNGVAFVAGENCYKDKKPYPTADPPCETEYLVVNGHKQEPFDRIHHVVFSPDGKSYAYPARIDETDFLVVNGVKKKIDGETWLVKFSPERRSIAYEMRTTFSRYGVANYGTHDYIVKNNLRFGPYYSAQILSFSQDSKKLIYTANTKCTAKGCSEGYYIDGKLIKNLEHRPIDLYEHPENPSNNYIEHKYNRNEKTESDPEKYDYCGKTSLVVNEKRGNWYIYVNSPLFSSDKKNFAYTAGKNCQMNGLSSGCGNAQRLSCNQQIALLNHEEIGEYNSVTEMNFKDDKLAFFAVNDNKIYRVEVKL